MHASHSHSRPTVRWLLAGLFALAVTLPSALWAQGIPGLSAADQQDIRQFTFNEDVFQRLQGVVDEGRKMHIKKSNLDMRKVNSLDDMANQVVAADPRIKPLLDKYRFSPRQFLVANLALVSTVMTMRYAEQTGQEDAAASQLNPANVRFYKSHQQAMDKLVNAGAEQAGQGQ